MHSSKNRSDMPDEVAPVAADELRRLLSLAEFRGVVAAAGAFLDARPELANGPLLDKVAHHLRLLDRAACYWADAYRMTNVAPRAAEQLAAARREVRALRGRLAGLPAPADDRAAHLARQEERIEHLRRLLDDPHTSRAEEELAYFIIDPREDVTCPAVVAHHLRLLQRGADSWTDAYRTTTNATAQDAELSEQTLQERLASPPSSADDSECLASLKKLQLDLDLVPFIENHLKLSEHVYGMQKIFVTYRLMMKLDVTVFRTRGYDRLFACYLHMKYPKDFPEVTTPQPEPSIFGVIVWGVSMLAAPLFLLSYPAYASSKASHNVWRGPPSWIVLALLASVVAALLIAGLALRYQRVLEPLLFPRSRLRTKPSRKEERKGTSAKKEE